MFKIIFNLPRTVWLICAISLLNDTASDMLYPIIPLYLTYVFMAGPKALGLIEGVAEATSSLLKFFSGVIVDRTRRAKPWIVSGYVIAGFGRPIIAFVSSWLWVLVIRFADRAGKGLRSSPRDALLAVSVTPENRGLAFGFHRAMDNAGAVLGPLLAAFFIAKGISLREIFLIAFIPAILCLGISLLIKEPQNWGVVIQKPRFSWTLKDFPPPFKYYLFTVALFTLSNSSNMFLLLRAKELGLPEVQVPLAWALVSFVAMLFSTPLSALSDRFGRIGFIIGGWGVYGIFYLGLGLLKPGTPLPLFILFAFYGLFMAATEGVEKALVADLTPKELIGTAYGWFNLVSGALLLPASIIFGWIYENVSALAAFGFSASCALAAALLLITWVKVPKNEKV